MGDRGGEPQHKLSDKFTVWWDWLSYSGAPEALGGRNWSVAQSLILKDHATEGLKFFRTEVADLLRQHGAEE